MSEVKKMKNDELEFLKEAYLYLENPSFITRVTDYLGKPIQKTMNRMPPLVQEKLSKASERALRKSLDVAHTTLQITSEKALTFDEIKAESSKLRLGHNLATTTTGALGGFFGEIGFLLELPVTTTLIMRSILAQGHNYGNLTREELITNALYVFSLGSGKSRADDEMDTAYYTSRFAMDYAIKKAAEYLASNAPKTVLKNIEAGSAPLVLELITKVASRFNITVGEKMLAESLPIVGAVGGATINLLFTNFFTLSAKYHFGIKYLENKYGEDIIQEHYSRIIKNSSTAA